MHRFRSAVPAAVFIAGVGVLAQTQNTQPPKASEKITLGDDSTSTRKLSNMRRTTSQQRKAAAARAAKPNRKIAPGGPITPQLNMGQVPTLSLPTWSLLFSGLHANYANSPAIPKFTVTLPGLCTGNGADTLNPDGTARCIPVANADTTTYPGSDYYELEETQYTQLLHPSLSSPTLLRGYHQTNKGTDPSNSNSIVPPAAAHYLGPIIVAQRNRPVRLKMTNNLPHGTALSPGAGNLFIPTDTTIMGAGMGPNGGSELYTQNRTAVHLHGGVTPWISDGTPHQWFTPSGETTSYQKGASFMNVPDMIGTGKSIPSPNPGDGMATFYYTNQQSGRLMFYHDHAYGITRLNVYAGLAAGYLLHDSVEDALIASGVLPNQSDLGPLYHWGVPLIIQDKTFVPDSTTMNTTTGTVNGVALGGADPTWAAGGWGGPDHGYGHNLWFPHVYMTNQNPADPEGVNPMGRWDYGPWFWPVQTSLTMGMPATCTDNSAATCPNIPNPTLVPEAFMDTMLVNGAPYPNVTVQPKAYRFRILNASNDRTVSLQLYYAVNPNLYVSAQFAANGTLVTPAAGVCNSSASTQANCTEVGMVDAVPHKTANPAQALNSYNNMLLCSTATPTGPAGLPNVAALNILSTPVPGALGTGLPGACWPTTWPTDGRDGGVPDPLNAGPAIIQVGTEGGLLPNPVVIPSTPVGYDYNRRDIVVLNVSTHGLMLGPAERADVIVDFSQVPSGSTLILYNDAPAPDPGFDSRLDYYTGDPEQRDTGGAATTVPGFGPNTRTVMQFRVSGAAAAQYSLSNLQNTSTGLPNAYKLSQPAPLVQESAYNPVYGTSYTDHFSRIGDTALHIDTTANTTPMQPKAIQELFTTDYGRMNATLGTELPLTSFLTQTTIPLAYVDPPTEVFNPGELQVWKITHNGVDTHSIHFHLFNVQVINRVGWDGAIRGPDANEEGWKETVRMNPLEDAIVALQPTTMSLPPSIPMSNSYRLLDPTAPVGSSSQFTGVDPLTNNPITVTNQMTDFGWEYVWHCHLLGHEENDMMRPMVMTVPVPGAPTFLQATAVAPTQVNLSWTYTQGIPLATGFYIYRKTGNGAFGQIATLPTVVVKAYSDVTVAPGTTYTYYVVAYTAGTPITLSTPSNNATVTTGLVAPVNLTVRSIGSRTATIGWQQPNTGGVSGYYVERAVGNGAFVRIATVMPATTLVFTNNLLATGQRYTYRVQAFGAGGITSAYSNVVTFIAQ